jgi:chaperonin cofactor prefoldin
VPAFLSLSAHSVRTRAISIILTIVAALVVAACGGSDEPASYVGKASNAVVYVSWTRSNDSLSGQLTQALAADDVTQGTVNTQRVGFDGTVDGSAVSLRLNGGLGATSTLTGKLDGDTLALDYPGGDGGVITIRLHKGDSVAFNSALAALRDKAASAKQQADQVAADQQASEQAAQLADGVRTAIAALDQAAENATATGPDLYQSDLDTISSDLDTVKSSYEVVTEDVANGYNDTICDDASSVGDDVDNMKSDIDSMHGDVKSNSDPSVLDDDIQYLREQLAQMQGVDPAMLPADAPTQDEVDQAIRAARRKVRAEGGQGADFTKAQALLGQAEAIKAKADAACQAHGV